MLSSATGRAQVAGHRLGDVDAAPARQYRVGTGLAADRVDRRGQAEPDRGDVLDAGADRLGQVGEQSRGAFHPVVGDVVGLQRHQLLGEDLAGLVGDRDPDITLAEGDPGEQPAAGRERDQYGAAAVADAAGQTDHAGLVELADHVRHGRGGQAGGGGDLDLGQRAVLPDDPQNALAVGFAQRSLRPRRWAGCVHYIKITDREAFAAKHRLINPEHRPLTSLVRRTPHRSPATVMHHQAHQHQTLRSTPCPPSNEATARSAGRGQRLWQPCCRQAFAAANSLQSKARLHGGFSGGEGGWWCGRRCGCTVASVAERAGGGEGAGGGTGRARSGGESGVGRVVGRGEVRWLGRGLGGWWGGRVRWWRPGRRRWCRRGWCGLGG